MSTTTYKCDYCHDNPTFCAPGERCPFCGMLFGEVYVSEGGCTLWAKGHTCYHVHGSDGLGHRGWFEVYDFGENGISATYWGPTANRENLGTLTKPEDVPAAVLPKVLELVENMAAVPEPAPLLQHIDVPEFGSMNERQAVAIASSLRCEHQRSDLQAMPWQVSGFGTFGVLVWERGRTVQTLALRLPAA